MFVVYVVSLLAHGCGGQVSKSSNSVEGTVVLEGGGAAAGAFVQVADAAMTERFGMDYTDRAGRFAIRVPADREAFISVELRRGCPNHPGPVKLNPMVLGSGIDAEAMISEEPCTLADIRVGSALARAGAPVHIVLKRIPSARHWVTCVDLVGEPVAGVYVGVRGQGGDLNDYWAGTTSSDGSIEIEMLPTEDVSLLVDDGRLTLPSPPPTRMRLVYDGKPGGWKLAPPSAQPDMPPTSER